MSSFSSLAYGASSTQSQSEALRETGKTMYQALEKKANTSLHIHLPNAVSTSFLKQYGRFLPYYAVLYGSGTLNNGEYLVNNYSWTYGYSQSYRDWYYHFIYLSNAKAESQANTLANQIVQQQKFTSYSSQYAKVKAIYDWICKNVSYYYQLPSTTHSQYNIYRTPYAALKYKKTVCSGYAGAFYLLAKKSGLSPHIVVGTVDDKTNDSQSTHAWNLVRIGSSDYNIDSTSDSYSWEFDNGQKASTQQRPYFFFLKSNNDYYYQTNHFQKVPPFSTSLFTTKISMANKNYQPPTRKPISYKTYCINSYYIKLAYVTSSGTPLSIQGKQIYKGSQPYSGKVKEYHIIRTPSGKLLANQYRNNRTISKGYLWENNKKYDTHSRVRYFYRTKVQNQSAK